MGNLDGSIHIHIIFSGLVKWSDLSRDGFSEFERMDSLSP